MKNSSNPEQSIKKPLLQAQKAASQIEISTQRPATTDQTSATSSPNTPEGVSPDDQETTTCGSNCYRFFRDCAETCATIITAPYRNNTIIY